MTTITKTRQIDKMTSLGIEENLGHMARKQGNFKVSIRNSINFTNELKSTAKHRPGNNGKKDVQTFTASSSQNDYLGHSNVNTVSVVYRPSYCFSRPTRNGTIIITPFRQKQMTSC